jgi:hypothetical protein
MRRLPTSWTTTMTKLGLARSRNRAIKVSTLRRSRSLALEVFESRRVLTAASFVRLDGIPPMSVPTSDDISVAEQAGAIAAGLIGGSGFFFDADPDEWDGTDSLEWTIERDEMLAFSGQARNAVIPSVVAGSASEVLAKVNAEIEEAVYSPTVNLAAMQIGGKQTGPPIWNNEFRETIAGAISQGILYTRFQFQAPEGDEEETFLYAGAISIDAGGIATASAYGIASFGTAVGTPLVDPDRETPGGLNGIRIWLEGSPPILIAEAFVDVDGAAWAGLALTVRIQS